MIYEEHTNEWIPLARHYMFQSYHKSSPQINFNISHNDRDEKIDRGSRHTGILAYTQRNRRQIMQRTH
jgi:hypothetical protein